MASAVRLYSSSALLLLTRKHGVRHDHGEKAMFRGCDNVEFMTAEVWKGASLPFSTAF